MRRTTQGLSSLTFTAAVLIGLVLWLTWGILLTRTDAYHQGFGEMNSRLLRAWLMDPTAGFALLKFWFAGLCLLVLLLGVNLVFCSWTKILRIMRIKFSGPKLFMLMVHAVFGAVALGHLGGFMLGFKHDRVKLAKGQSFQFGDGYTLRIEDVRFVDDPSVLRKTRRELTRDQFHYRKNFVQASLFQGKQEITRDRIYLFRPLRHDGVQITLKRFLPLGKHSGPRASGRGPPAMFIISRNPVLPAFLCLYPMMILGIIIHLGMTWRGPYGKRGPVGPRPANGQGRGFSPEPAAISEN